MDYRKVVAIVRNDRLEAVEDALCDAGVSGITVTRVKGFGERPNFFAGDWTAEHARLEVFTEVDRADTVARAAMEAAATDHTGDGLVAVLPVETVYRVRTRAEPEPGTL